MVSYAGQTKLPGKSTGGTTIPVPATDEIALRLIAAAREAFQNAYAPYSNFRVGAAIRTRNGTELAGCNVEDATMNLGVCAERAAIVSAVIAEGPAMKIDTIAVIAESAAACSPCGNCRQLFSEFADETSTIIFAGEAGFMTYTLDEILPHTFRLERSN